MFSTYHNIYYDIMEKLKKNNIPFGNIQIVLHKSTSDILFIIIFIQYQLNFTKYYYKINIPKYKYKLNKTVFDKLTYVFSEIVFKDKINDNKNNITIIKFENSFIYKDNFLVYLENNFINKLHLNFPNKINEINIINGTIDTNNNIYNNNIIGKINDKDENEIILENKINL
jgi:hypothetical protein